MLFKHKSVVKVDMADLDGEKENLANFLRSQFKLNSSITPRLGTKCGRCSDLLIGKNGKQVCLSQESKQHALGYSGK